MKKFVRILLIIFFVIILSSCVKNKFESVFQTVCSADDALELSKKTDTVVIEGQRCTSGKDVWDTFYETISNQSPASVLCAHYYVLDQSKMSKALYEEQKDRYPKLFFYQVDYDGKEFLVKVRESTQKTLDYQDSFLYLCHFTGTAPATATYSAYDNYVLVDDPSATWEGILEGLFSSQLSAGYKHLTVFQNIIE